MEKVNFLSISNVLMTCKKAVRTRQNHPSENLSDSTLLQTSVEVLSLLNKSNLYLMANVRRLEREREREKDVSPNANRFELTLKTSRPAGSARTEFIIIKNN